MILSYIENQAFFSVTVKRTIEDKWELHKKERNVNKKQQNARINYNN